MILIFSTFSLAQTARIKGVILDEFNLPVENVTIKSGEKWTVSDKTGFYLLEIPANQENTVVLSHISFKKTTVKVLLLPNEDYEFNPVLNSKVEEIGGVTLIGSSNKKRVEGITTIDPIVIRKIPEQMLVLKTLLKPYQVFILITN